QLEIERQALTREKDPASRERLEQIDRELSRQREEADRLKMRWQTEKDSIAEIHELKEKIDKLKLEESQAERDGDLGKVAEIRYGTLTQLEKELEEASNRHSDLTRTPRMLKEEVDEEDIAQIVAKWTGIPVSRMLEGEVAKLVHMEDRLRKCVIGQEEPLAHVSNA